MMQQQIDVFRKKIKIFEQKEGAKINDESSHQKELLPLRLSFFLCVGNPHRRTIIDGNQTQHKQHKQRLSDGIKNQAANQQHYIFPTPRRQKITDKKDRQKPKNKLYT